VNKYQLVWKGNVIAEKAPSTGAVHFELDNNVITVAKNSTERVTLRVVLNSISNYANSGKKFIASLYAVEARAQGGAALASVTNVAVTDSYANGTALDGNSIVAYATKPTVSTVPMTGLVLSNSALDVYRFSVAADTMGDVSWKVINLNLSGTCTSGTIAECLGATSSMKLKLNGSEVAATFATSSGRLQIVVTNPETITAGSSKTYTVEATLTGFVGDYDTLSIRVKDNNTAFAAPAAYGSVSETDTFVWSDNSGTDGDVSEAQWIDGYKTPGLDTDAFTLKR